MPHEDRSAKSQHVLIRDKTLAPLSQMGVVIDLVSSATVQQLRGPHPHAGGAPAGRRSGAAQAPSAHRSVMSRPQDTCSVCHPTTPGPTSTILAPKRPQKRMPDHPPASGPTYPLRSRPARPPNRTTPLLSEGALAGGRCLRAPTATCVSGPIPPYNDGCRNDGCRHDGCCGGDDYRRRAS